MHILSFLLGKLPHFSIFFLVDKKIILIFAPSLVSLSMGGGRSYI